MGAHASCVLRVPPGARWCSPTRLLTKNQARHGPGVGATGPSRNVGLVPGGTRGTQDACAPGVLRNMSYLVVAGDGAMNIRSIAKTLGA